MRHWVYNSIKGSFVRSIFVILFLVSSSLAFAEHEPICAKKYSELDLTEQLKKLKELLPAHQTIGLVNETKGSYIYLASRDDSFHITFITTGIFDLYGIKREGEIVFCDRGGQLLAIGLDRTQDLFVSGQKMQFGDKSEKESFVWGPLPEKLARKHNLDQPQIAAEP